MRLGRDFGEFISFANAHEVRFLVVGAYAVAAHGHPRFTKDLDVWILASPDNAERLLRALDDFGFGDVGLTAQDFETDGGMVQLGYPPNRIDILVGIDGVDFAACWERRLEVTIDGVSVPFIGLDDLVINKRASGSLQDLADVESLGGW